MASVQLNGEGGAGSSRLMGTSEENWTKSTALGTGLAVFAIALRRSLEVRWVTEAAREVMEQHSLLRAQAVQNAKGKLAFQVSSEAASPLVEVLPWPSRELASSSCLSGVLVLPDDEGDNAFSLALDQVIRQEMNAPFLNSEGKPSLPLDLFQIHVYSEPSQSQTIIIMRFHSSGLDRPSAVTVVQEFFTALNAIVDGAAPQLSDNPGTSVLLAPIEELIPKGKASKNFLQKGLDTVGYALNAKKYALLPFQPNYTDQRKEPFHSDFLTYTLGRAGTLDLLGACKQENTTLAGALAAAFLKAASNMKEIKDQKKDEFNFTSLVDCRCHFEPTLPECVMGNYVSGIPQTQQVKENMTFWDVARAVSSTTEKELSKYRHFSELPVINLLFSQVLKHPGVTPGSSMRTALFSLFVDKPLEGKWKDVEKLNVAATCGPMPSMHGVGPCFSVTEMLMEGPDLCVSLVYAQPVFNRDQMHTYATAVVELLNAAAKNH
ncbi:hypothetical protein BDL97_03G057500 [Sphagnum fallax]|nr:hypothetical protein BDL97_03G057500 [Sphagnum fallax]KAH8967048.1 hypothetical protein BDL97_03G057500 [Sphagnum fallax]KAH8967049.1 hypothetical protein BDL97_03G057500 [Sphagnum fallax]